MAIILPACPRYDLWSLTWKLSQQFPLPWWIFVRSVIEIPLTRSLHYRNIASLEIGAKVHLTYRQQTAGRTTDGDPTTCSPPTINGGSILSTFFFYFRILDFKNKARSFFSFSYTRVFGTALLVGYACIIYSVTYCMLDHCAILHASVRSKVRKRSWITRQTATRGIIHLSIVMHVRRSHVARLGQWTYHVGAYLSSEVQGIALDACWLAFLQAEWLYFLNFLRLYLTAFSALCHYVSST